MTLRYAAPGVLYTKTLTETGASTNEFRESSNQDVVTAAMSSQDDNGAAAPGLSVQLTIPSLGLNRHFEMVATAPLVTSTGVECLPVCGHE